ncbi:DUF3037 domain-containing protein [Micromonospora sp. NPDC049102]|uniref:DUF3037 domain-containing protein n=1 Tax=Micromonospora sp. NPDC049102 TaxID=3364265 RepID=UPI00370FD472
MLRQVTAIRYVTPLREGGSLPGVVEADDLGTYVAKFSGAGQGGHPFEYAVIRLVPRVERGEQINVGVLLYCQQRDFLAARTHLDADRVRALAPDVDLPAVAAVLDSLDRTCSGDGPATRMRLGERFRWLAAPRSTMIQAGPVHTGLAVDPAAELDRLMVALVR